MSHRAGSLQAQADQVREFNRFYTVHTGVLQPRYLHTEFSLSEGRIMYELSHQPGLTANELRTRLHLDAGYMSRLIRSLTERGLVEGQRAAHDKRSILLTLTAGGREAVAELNVKSSAQIIGVLDKLAQPQRAELLGAMQRIQELIAAAAQSLPQSGNVVVRGTPVHLADARLLLEEYFDVINVVLRDDEAAIRAFLNEPGSAMWVAYVDGTPAGCVALRALPDIAGAAECKRLYVADCFRRRGLADALMAALEAYAPHAGYNAIYLDTKDDLVGAVNLYRRLGYTDCPRYNNNPQATIFMQKRLDAGV